MRFRRALIDSQHPKIATVEIFISLMRQMHDLTASPAQYLLSVHVQPRLPSATRIPLLNTSMGKVPHLDVTLPSNQWTCTLWIRTDAPTLDPPGDLVHRIESTPTLTEWNQTSHGSMSLYTPNEKDFLGDAVANPGVSIRVEAEN